MRRYLQMMYVAIVQALANAELLSQGDPAMIPLGQAAGNPLARRCLHDALLWLRRVKEFASSEDAYLEQVAEPVRLAARFRLHHRASLHVIGLVASVSSEFYDRHFNAKMRDVCLIIPSLGGALSLRSDSEEVTHLRAGMTVELHGVQPIPYINRLHPVTLSLESKEATPSLSQLKFLSGSLLDTELIPGSLAFENFCTVACVQKRSRSLLGCPLLIGGRIFVDQPWLYLQDLTGARSIRLIAHKTALMSRIPDGSLAFVLAVVWYRKDLFPEALLVEAADNEEDVARNELDGFVRVRYYVKLGEAQTLFPNAVLSGSGYASIEGENLVWKLSWGSVTPDESDFMNCRQELLRIRNAGKTSEGRRPFIKWSSVLDREKLTLDALINQVARNDRLRDCLLQVIRYEETGRQFSSLAEFERPDIARWLIDMGLISRIKRIDKHTYLSTRYGKEVAFAALKALIKSMLRETLAKNGLVTLFEEADKSNTPHAILLRGLEELRNENIAPLTIGGREVKFIWIRLGDPVIESEARRYFYDILDQILSVLRRVHHPLHESKILNAVKKFDLPSLREALRLLESMGRLRMVGEGEWEYPYDRRLLDTMITRPDRFYSIEQLMDAAGIPPIKLTTVQKILEDLSAKGKIERVAWHHWAINSNEPELRQRLEELQLLKPWALYNPPEVHQRLRAILLIWECEQGLSLPASGCDEDLALRVLRVAALAKIQKKYPEVNITPEHVAREVLSRLLRERKIVRRDGRLYSIK